MLIEKKFGNNDVIVLKMVSGEEIIARLVNHTNEKFVVKKPLLLTLHTLGNGQGAIGFAPFMLALADDGEVMVSADRLLVAPVLARKEVANNYLKATTGLDVPESAATSKLII